MCERLSSPLALALSFITPTPTFFLPAPLALALSVIGARFLDRVERQGNRPRVSDRGIGLGGKLS